MSRSSVKAAASALAILGSALAFALLGINWTPRVDSTAPQAIGKTLAREARKLVTGPGEYIVIARETSTYKQPAADLVLDSFLAEVRQSGGKIIGVRAVELDPLRPVLVPSSDFMDLIHSAPEGSVVVSLMGPPLMTEEQRAQLGQIKPKIVAFCSGNLSGTAELKHVFDQGLLDTALVARYLVEPGKNTDAGFESQYRVMTKSASDGGKQIPGGVR